jgi:transposase-like protein
MLLCTDAQAAAADLASGVLACPSCHGGRLRPWGSARERVIRLPGGARQRVRPRRGRCGSCRATQVLLPSWMAPRRADAVAVIARAAVSSARHGTGSGRLGRELGVPAGTVRGWLRRLRSRAGDMRQDAMTSFGVLTAGRDAPWLEPSGSPLGNALAAVAACAHAAVTWHGCAAADTGALLGRFGIAAALMPGG